jgi:hypothetical protein
MALVPLIEDMRAYGLKWLLGPGCDDEDALDGEPLDVREPLTAAGV